MLQSATIFALSSGLPPSGVAVIRISGSGAKTAIRSLCGSVPEDRIVELHDICDRDGLLLDRGLVMVFSAPRSFTGEDCAELHIHGGAASVAAVLSALSELDGFRQADPGEFTRRAFINGKMDLTGVEALGDLISAETEMQRRFALANAGGRQFDTYRVWRERILHARAMIEAELDFSDEGDVPGSVADDVWLDMSALCEEMQSHVEGARTGEILRDGFRVVILGAPNAGKSSLLNRLADRDVAIVSDEAGTTRDLIEVVLDLGGVRTVVTDTAGLRDQPGRVEALGIERALKRAEGCDLIIVLDDLSRRQRLDVPRGPAVLRVGSKADLSDVDADSSPYDWLISSKTGEGIDGLVELIRAAALERIEGWAVSAVPSRLRHVEHVRSSRELTGRALSPGYPLELRAEALRLAGDEIGNIVGSIHTEDVLGRIFGQFCIGK